MELACRVLLDPGDRAWLEDPAWSGGHAAILAAGFGSVRRFNACFRETYHMAPREMRRLEEGALHTRAA